MLTHTRRLLLAAVLLVCATQAAAAQEPCALERAVAPDYGGVMLGMTPKELREMFPGAQELSSAPSSEAETFKVSLGMLDLNIRRDSFKGVEELTLTFIGGRVHRIDVLFRRPTPWESVAEFSEHASRRLAIPADAWGAVIRNAAKSSRLMECRGFAVVVRVDADGPSTLSIVDTSAAAPPKAR